MAYEEDSEQASPSYGAVATEPRPRNPAQYRHLPLRIKGVDYPDASSGYPGVDAYKAWEGAKFGSPPSPPQQGGTMSKSSGGGPNSGAAGNNIVPVIPEEGNYGDPGGGHGAHGRAVMQAVAGGAAPPAEEFLAPTSSVEAGPDAMQAGSQAQGVEGQPTAALAHDFVHPRTKEVIQVSKPDMMKLYQMAKAGNPGDPEQRKAWGGRTAAQQYMHIMSGELEAASRKMLEEHDAEYGVDPNATVQTSPAAAPSPAPPVHRPANPVNVSKGQPGGPHRDNVQRAVEGRKNMSSDVPQGPKAPPVSGVGNLVAQGSASKLSPSHGKVDAEGLGSRAGGSMGRNLPAGPASDRLEGKAVIDPQVNTGDAARQAARAKVDARPEIRNNYHADQAPDIAGIPGFKDTYFKEAAQGALDVPVGIAQSMMRAGSHPMGMPAGILKETTDTLKSIQDRGAEASKHPMQTLNQISPEEGARGTSSLLTGAALSKAGKGAAGKQQPVKASKIKGGFSEPASANGGTGKNFQGEQIGSGRNMQGEVIKSSPKASATRPPSKPPTRPYTDDPPPAKSPTIEGPYSPSRPMPPRPKAASASPKMEAGGEARVQGTSKATKGPAPEGPANYPPPTQPPKRGKLGSYVDGNPFKEPVPANGGKPPKAPPKPAAKTADTTQSSGDAVGSAFKKAVAEQKPAQSFPPIPRAKKVSAEPAPPEVPQAPAQKAPAQSAPQKPFVESPPPRKTQRDLQQEAQGKFVNYRDPARNDAALGRKPVKPPTRPYDPNNPGTEPSNNPPSYSTRYRVNENGVAPNENLKSPSFQYKDIPKTKPQAAPAKSGMQASIDAGKAADKLRGANAEAARVLSPGGAVDKGKLQQPKLKPTAPEPPKEAVRTVNQALGRANDPRGTNAHLIGEVKKQAATATDTKGQQLRDKRAKVNQMRLGSSPAATAARKDSAKNAKAASVREQEANDLADKAAALERRQNKGNYRRIREASRSN